MGCLSLARERGRVRVDPAHTAAVQFQPLTSVLSPCARGEAEKTNYKTHFVPASEMLERVRSRDAK